MKFGVLRIRGADGGVREIPLEQPSVIVGRAESSAVVIDDISVARRHARLAIESGRLMVEDLGSATGTFLGEERLPPNLPSLAGEPARLRFGEVIAEYSPPGEAAGGTNGHGAPDEVDERMKPLLRATLISPAEVAQPGGSAVSATLAVANTGSVVDRLRVTVQELPGAWVEVSPPELVLVPGARGEATIRIRPPRSPEAESGLHEFAVVITSAETGREEVVTGSVSVARFDDTQVTLHPQRGKKHFRVAVQNRGNGRLDFGLRGEDDEGSLRYEFEQQVVTIPPGERRELRLRVRPPRQFFGTQRVDRFRVLAEPGDPEAAGLAEGQLVVRPPLQRFTLPAVYLLVLVALAGGALAFLMLRPEGEAPASPEDLYAGVHLCDKKEPDPNGPTPTNTPDTGEPGFTGEQTGVPYFAQNNPLWGQVEYARAKDPEFGPDWCGSTIEQCGCAMTSVATVLAMYSLLEMPGGEQLTPETLNAWFNGEATRTDRGWVSRGYIYGDVIWTAVNQLSGEMAEETPGAPTIRFRTTGTGSEEEVRAELNAGRFVILEVPGHWIAAIGLEEDGTILINDPFYRDRTTLDAYKTDDGRSLVKSSVLFEPSDDLRAVVFSAPADVRMRITDKQGRVVGTLNTGSAEEAEQAAQVGIPGASYSSRQAWRDPTCVMSPPPPDAGTNQIVLPGGAEDYKVEVIDTAGRPTSVAVHTYDANGRSQISEIKAEGAVVAEVKVDEDTSGAQIDIIEDATPTPESEITPGDGNGGNGGGTPATGDGTPTAPAGTPQPTATPTIVPADTIMSLPAEAGQTRVEVASHAGFFIGDTIVFSPGTAIEEANTIAGFGSFLLATPLTFSHPAGSKIVRVAAAPPGEGGEPEGPPPAPPPLQPPEAVSVSCATIYNVSPPRATMICRADIQGDYTTIRWTSNGSVVTEATNNRSLTVRFTQDTPVTIVATACNITICRSSSTTETIRFPATTSGGTSVTGGGTAPPPLPTAPPSGVGLSCTANFDVLSQKANIDCEVLLQENRAFTSITWSAPKGDPSSGMVTKTEKREQGGTVTIVGPFTTSTTDPNATIPITATVCNFRACETSQPFEFKFGATTVEISVFPESSSGEYPQFTDIDIVGTVIGPTVPTGGTVIFRANGTAFPETGTVIPGAGIAIIKVSAPEQPLSQLTAYTISGHYTGSGSLFPGDSTPETQAVITIVPGVPDDCNSLDDDTDTRVDENCVSETLTFNTSNQKSVGGGTLVQDFTIAVNSGNYIGRFAVARPGQRLDFAGTVTRTTYCPGCIRQVYFALAPNTVTTYGGTTPISGCMVSRVIFAPITIDTKITTPYGGSAFAAPLDPGVYYVRVMGSLDYSCVNVGMGGPPTSVGRVIVRDNTTTTLTISPSTFPVGDDQDVTLSAAVTANGGRGTPNGTVSFSGISGMRCTGPGGGAVNDGAAVALTNGSVSLTCDASGLSAGGHNITASFEAADEVGQQGGGLESGTAFWESSPDKQQPPQAPAASQTKTLTAAGPTISNLSPSSAIRNSGSFELTVNGSNFANGSKVVFDGTEYSPSSKTSTQLKVTIPNSQLQTARLVDVKVKNPGGTESTAGQFTINNPSPTITNISPNTGIAGAETTPFAITGTGFFSGTTTVTFDPDGNGPTAGSALSGLTINATTINGSIPSNLLTTAGNATVTVTNPTPGGGSVSTQFTIKAVPTLSLSVSGSPAALGGTITLTATFGAAHPDFGTIAGTVRFCNGGSDSNCTGGTELGTDTTIVSGVASLATTALPAGTHNSLRAYYLGQGNYAPSASNTASATVNKSNTSTAIVASPTSGAFGTSVTLTATVSESPSVAGFAPGGTVRFCNGGSDSSCTGGTELGTDTLDGSGEASIQTTTLPGGTNTIRAYYLGDSNFNTSNGSTTVTITANTTTTTLTAPADGTSQQFGTQVTFTATVAAASNPDPGQNDGHVEFRYDTGGGNSTLIGTAQKSGNSYTLATATLNAGTYEVFAKFIATNGSYTGSTSSGTNTLTITALSTTVSIGASPGTITIGGSSTLTATMTPSAATGTVRFCVSGTGPNCNGGNLIGEASLSSGSASVDVTPSAAGTYSYSAHYLGSTNYSASNTTMAATLNVNNPAPTIGSLNPNSATAGAGDTALTITGTGFISGVTTVTFDPPGATGPQAMTITVVSSTQITTTISSGWLATAGTAVVTVTNATPGGGSATGNFTINPP